MPVNVNVNSIEFLNEFKNDIGFVSNLGDVTNNLTGSVMERAFFRCSNFSYRKCY